MKKTKLLTAAIGVVGMSFVTQGAFADCKSVKYNDLQTIANAVVDGEDSGGFKLPMWVSVVDETGKVCHVVNTNPGGKSNNGRSNESWLGSRIISAQKANTANAFSIDGNSISTANLYGLVQPGGSLYGLQHSNPVDASRAYAGSPNTFGTNGDPLKNKRIGGVNVFGGGLALYKGGRKVGAIGVSGDTSCTDHVVAWKIRHQLGLDSVPAGLSGGDKGDEMVITSGSTVNNVYHPTCPYLPAEGADNGVIYHNGD